MENMKENKYLRWLSGATDSVYWHDSAIPEELSRAETNGAVGVTTNPILVYSSLRNHADFWEDKLKHIDESVQADERAEALTKCVTSTLVEKLSKHAKKKGGGFCCAQVNPIKHGDQNAMVEQARRYSQVAEKIVVKLPATSAGIRAFEECAAKGLNVAATVSFTVAQVLAVGEAYERGRKKAEANGIEPGLGIAVLMVGRLDDYLRDVALDTGAGVSEEDIRCSGLAAIKRAYSVFKERGYTCKIMPAGFRGPYHITELSGADMIMSILPKIADTLLSVPEPFSTRIDVPVPADAIKRLLMMPEFIKAYEPNGLDINEFVTYGATNRTLTQFCLTGWDRLAALDIGSH